MNTISEVTIQSAAAAVFEFLCDPEKIKGWLSDFLSADGSLDAPAGTKLMLTFAQMGGGKREAATEILAREPGRLLIYKMADRSFEIVVRLELDSIGGGTRLIQKLDATARTPEMAALAKQYAGQAAQQHQRDLDKLKLLVESGTSAAEAP